MRQTTQGASGHRGPKPVSVFPVKVPHYERPPVRPFTADERATTTILFGNLTPAHEALIEAVFRGSGYLCQALPTPTRANCLTGKQFCNNGLCNPNYFTAGNLIDYLRGLRDSGLTVSEVVDRFVYFTIGGCGPCRFGMYESEYRQALDSAGFPGFRVFTFHSNSAVLGGSKQPGLRYTVNFGLGMLNALNLGDVLFDVAHRIRPYEVVPGATDHALAACLADLAGFLRERCGYEFFRKPRHGRLADIASILGRIRYHLNARDWKATLARVQDRLNDVEVDWLRVKPAVKVTGEFYSAISEGDANYNLFRSLENEGAEVHVDPIGNLILYWIYQARLQNQKRKGLRPGYWKKAALLGFCEWFWGWQYRRTAAHIGGPSASPERQAELGCLAKPYYDLLTRGGEGHLIAARGVDAALRGTSHLMISVKPFGCMPSTQSDGVMAQVVADHPSLHFLPLETLGEGEVHALSRVQMALGDARDQARDEFEIALLRVGRSIASIRDYVRRHPEMRRACYRVPPTPGVAGTAARFVLHVARRMETSR
ncbi:hypothetical protein [uncultured Paludibaculum sp.]|uniref:hypothetical protein n=1 Tax=uncultured Paludibaculum sp. TaxID=1765020 RepID=UPI002AAC23EE|nr:hypothetical protein [uncultured Paludibaculum sp.]